MAQLIVPGVVWTRTIYCATTDTRIEHTQAPLHINLSKGSFLQAHQDNSKYTQQYKKSRRLVTFSSVSIFGLVLLSIMLVLSAFIAIHVSVGVQPQLVQQSISSKAMQHGRVVLVPRETATVSPKQATPQPHKSAPPFPVAQVPKVVPPTPTPIPVSPSTPTPTPTAVPTQPVVTPTPSGGGSGSGSGSGSSIVSMIDQVFGADAPTAVQIATCESGLNPNAYNPASIGGSHAAGLFQILYPSSWYTTPEAGLSPYDAMANIQAAHSIFVRDGYSWREWTC